jgi:hypothetical protein
VPLARTIPAPPLGPRYLHPLQLTQFKSSASSFGRRSICKEFPLAKRNFGFEKRQKEIARKQKQEEKKKRRLDRTHDTPDEANPDAPATTDPTPTE